MIGARMSHLSDKADISAVIGHIDLALKLLETLNYEEFGMAESFLGDASFELHSWKDQPKFTKRGSYCGP
jgi:hypothetical protein